MRLTGWTLVGLLVLVSVLLDWLGLSWDPGTEPEDLFRLIFVFSLLLSQANLLVVWAVLGGKPAVPWRLVGLLVAFSAWIWALEVEWPASAEVQIGGHILLLPQIVATSLLLLILRGAGFRVTDLPTDQSGGDSAEGLRWWQFSLASLLAAAVALAVVLGMPEDFPSVALGPPSFTELIDVSIGLRVLLAGNAVIALLALWTILGTPRPLRRILVLGLTVAAVGMVLLAGDFTPLPIWFLPTLCLSQAIVLIGYLGVVHLAGHQLVWQPNRLRRLRVVLAHPIWIAAAVRWTARVLGVLLLVITLSFYVMEGGPNPAKLSLIQGLQFASHGLALLGLVVLWVWELPGGLLTVAGMVGFCTANYLAVGRFPGGWVFPLFYLPAGFALISWTLARRNGPSPDGPSGRGRGPESQFRSAQ
jgi:hypothetical protein